MLDDLNRRSGAETQRDGAPRPSAQVPAMADREIPIISAAPFDAMHRWLDGESSEAAAVQDPETARYVALWRRVGQETARRASQRPSADFASRVMSALPPAAPVRADLTLVSATEAPVTAAPALAAAAPQAASPAATATWWQGPVEMNRGAALAAATGLVALGLLLGASFRGQ